MLSFGFLFCVVLYIVELCHALLCCVVLFPSSVQGLLQHGGPAGWASGGVPGSGLPAARHHPARTPPRTRLLARTVQVTTVSLPSSEPRQDGPGLLREHTVEEHRNGEGGPVRQVSIEQIRQDCSLLAGTRAPPPSHTTWAV